LTVRWTIELPESFDLLLLTDDYVRTFILPCELSEELKSFVAFSFNHRDMADEGDALQVAACIATAIEGAAIQGTHQTIVANKAGHNDRVNRPLGEKGQNFTFVYSPNDRIASGCASNGNAEGIIVVAVLVASACMALFLMGVGS